MLEATRLTRAGRLTEATALLQRALQRHVPTLLSSRAPRPRARRPDAARALIDLTPEHGRARRIPAIATRGPASGAGASSRPTPAQRRRTAPHASARGAARLARPGQRDSPRARHRWARPARSGVRARGRAGRRHLPRGFLRQPGRQPRLQALCPERLSRAGGPLDRHAARLHPVARRLRRRYADERARGGENLPGRLSCPGRLRQCLEMLELVQTERPAARPRRALADRGHHAADHARLCGRPRARLCRRAVGGRGRRCHHGDDLPRSLRRDWRAFRPGLRRCRRPSFRVCRHAPGRGRRRTPLRRMPATGPDHRLPWGSGQHGSSAQRRSRDRTVEGQRGHGTCRPAWSRVACPAGMRTAARCIPTRAGRRSWSSGSSTATAMPGRAAAPRAPSPIRRDPMRRERCCASSSSTDIPTPRDLSPPTDAGSPSRRPDALRPTGPRARASIAAVGARRCADGRRRSIGEPSLRSVVPHFSWVWTSAGSRPRL